MSDDVLTPGPQSGASAGQRCLGQVAWRLALVEELRTAWVEAQDLIEALSAASAPDVDSELNPMLRHWIALAERQLRQLAYVGDRLDERVSTSKTGAALFWKVEALNVDHPPGPARDAALFQGTAQPSSASVPEVAEDGNSRAKCGPARGRGSAPPGVPRERRLTGQAFGMWPLASSRGRGENVSALV